MSGKPIEMKINLGGGGGGGRGGAQKQTDPRVQMKLLELLNAERSRAGVPALLMSVQLNGAAHEHSADMAQRGYLGVTTPEGDPIRERTRRATYEGNAEALVAMGPSTPEQALAEWYKSPPHKLLALSTTFQHVGVGLVDGMWTVVLAAPHSAAATDVREIRGRVLDLVNRERSQAGVTPLELSEPLARAAQEHAADMARRDYFGSASPDNETVATRAQKAGFAGRSVACLTKGPSNPDDAFAAWLKSSRGNIVHPELRYLGVATTDGRWVLALGTR